MKIKPYSITVFLVGWLGGLPGSWDRRRASSALISAGFESVGTDHRWERLGNSDMLFLGVSWLVRPIEHADCIEHGQTFLFRALFSGIQAVAICTAFTVNLVLWAVEMI